jgi:hypothetical protein
VREDPLDAPAGAAESLLFDEPFEQPDERALILGRQPGEGMRPARDASREVGPQARAVACQMEDFHAAIFGGRPALDKAARLEAIDETCHVRGIAAEPFREPAHRERLAGLQQVQDVALDGGQIDLGRRRELRPLREEEAEQQAPGARGIGIGARHLVILTQNLYS